VPSPALPASSGVPAVDLGSMRYAGLLLQRPQRTLPDPDPPASDGDLAPAP
jgi:hypothetical protein